MFEFLIPISVAILGVLLGAAITYLYYHKRIPDELPDTVTQVVHQPFIDLPSILRSLPGVAILLDHSEQIVWANTKAYRKGLVKGERLIHSPLIELVARVRQQGGAAEQDVTVPRSTFSDSAELQLHVRVTPLPTGQLFLVAEDVTAKNRIEAARQDFTANMSHELKTPVGAIHLLAETIALNSDDPETVARFADRLRVESDRLTALVQDIIELSRFQGPDALASPDLVEVDDVIAEAIESHEVSAEVAQINLIAPDDKSGAKVWGDKKMLVTAVKNLIENALHYSREGGWVRVQVAQVQHRVHIRVIDNGVGISTSDQKRIFERFYRSDPARSRITGGTGLGLSIVKHVANDHGGKVNVTSILGQGSTFTLVLPEVDLSIDISQ